jgi:hypothetical protein
VLPTITFALLYAWPFLEARVTGDRSRHELLDRPRYRPVRTAIGTGVLAFYVVLFAAGSQDIFAQHLDMSIVDVNRTFRILLVAAPLVVAAVTLKWCHDLQRGEADEDGPEAPTLPPPDEPHADEDAAPAPAPPEHPGFWAGVGLAIAAATRIGRSRRRRREQPHR